MLLTPLVASWGTSLVGVYQDRYAVIDSWLTVEPRNYDHVAGLWEHEGWLPQSAIDFARSHYTAYMVKRQDGLRVISLNTDMCM